jgi:hypothetical protein
MSSGMSHLIDKILGMPVPFNMVVIIAAISIGAGIVTSVAKQIRKYVCLKHELDFKRDMIDRGMTVAEVEQLMAVKSPLQTDESHRGTTL